VPRGVLVPAGEHRRARVAAGGGEYNQAGGRSCGSCARRSSSSATTSYGEGSIVEIEKGDVEKTGWLERWGANERREAAGAGGTVGLAVPNLDIPPTCFVMRAPPATRSVLVQAPPSPPSAFSPVECLRATSHLDRDNKHTSTPAHCSSSTSVSLQENAHPMVMMIHWSHATLLDHGDIIYGPVQFAVLHGLSQSAERASPRSARRSE